MRKRLMKESEEEYLIEMRRDKRRIETDQDIESEGERKSGQNMKYEEGETK